eukprot:TRINITY_DN2737_c0_g2_i1.p1 TRINITY_DN2737_c0_g2~~TRINITY_DN2737_c0_g2_i1.p1  ORF type:complete len:453 (-),score=66.37 TRINITY_DN2737_c0_g2_i1:166-1524(-)
MGLQRALGGLFSASLNFMDLTSTFVPQFTFRPEGDLHHPFDTNESHGIRYAVLPREAVCTENLTPYLRQLPCRQHSGIAKLLQSPTHLYRTKYHSMGIHFKTLCSGTSSSSSCDYRQMELKQTLTLVFNPNRNSVTGKSTYKLQTIFGVRSTDLSACPLARSSLVHVTTSNVSNHMEIGQIPSESYNVYTLTEAILPLFSILVYPNFAQNSGRAPVFMNRYLTGYGRDSSGVVIHIINSLNRGVHFIFLQSIPWYLRVYYHTLRVSLNQTLIPISEIFGDRSNYHILPGKDRERSSVLEFFYYLPANSILTLELQVERALLHWTEYPPDPNRGFDIGPAVLQVLSVENLKTHNFPTQSVISSPSFCLYTNGLMVMMPLPDFSMPYNVITLSSTVVALFFGQIVSALTRRYGSTYVGGREFISRRPLAQLFRSMLKNRFVRKVLGDTGSETQE